LYGFSGPLGLKLGVWRHTGEGRCDVDPKELVLTFGGSYVCVNFGENRWRNATVRVRTDGQTHKQTHTQTQTDFIICPMLYTMAMGQITRLHNIQVYLNNSLQTSQWSLCVKLVGIYNVSNDDQSQQRRR